jgi:hypothetical protein
MNDFENPHEQHEQISRAMSVTQHDVLYDTGGASQNVQPETLPTSDLKADYELTVAALGSVSLTGSARRLPSFDALIGGLNAETKQFLAQQSVAPGISVDLRVSKQQLEQMLFVAADKQETYLLPEIWDQYTDIDLNDRTNSAIVLTLQDSELVSKQTFGEGSSKTEALTEPGLVNLAKKPFVQLEMVDEEAQSLAARGIELRPMSLFTYLLEQTKRRLKAAHPSHLNYLDSDTTTVFPQYGYRRAGGRITKYLYADSVLATRAYANDPGIKTVQIHNGGVDQGIRRVVALETSS